MDEVIIRKATILDLKSIQELNNYLFNLEYKNFDNTLKVGWPFENEGKEYFEYMINNEIVYVAQYKEKIVGYLAGSICEQISYVKETFGEIDNMYVAEKYRRLGIGTKLINKFKEYCKENKLQNIKVTASAGNSKAIQFYKRNGFGDYDITLKYKI